MQAFHKSPNVLLRCLAFRHQDFSSTAVARKSAIVTGSGQGIGCAIALRLAKDGFNVCVNDIQQNSKLVDSVVTEIKEKTGQNAIAAYADVSKRNEVERMVQYSVDELGSLSVMVSNAGIAQVKRLIELTDEDLQRMWEVNINGVIYCAISAAKVFIKQGGGGKIINACSIAAKKGAIFLPHYAATKGAVDNLTKTFAMDFAPHNITSNAYSPGIVDTHMWNVIEKGMSSTTGLPNGDNFKKETKRILLGRASVPEDVANTVAFLASPDSDYMTGQTLGIDGGIL